jgi:hypothetical protein
MTFNATLATIAEEDAVDIYHEILCGDEKEEEEEDDEFTFQVCLAVGMELM